MTRSPLPSLFGSRSGVAAVEMALVLPLLLTILSGSIEVGNYFRNEHTLAKAVRDGARYAARQDFIQYTGCDGSARDVPTPGITGSVNENTKLIVRKGSLSTTDDDLLPLWASGTTDFKVTMTCSTTTSGGTTMSGIYAGNAVGTADVAPTVTVTAKLPYRPALFSFGFQASGLFLNASGHAAVTGV